MRSKPPSRLDQPAPTKAPKFSKELGLNGLVRAIARRSASSLYDFTPLGVQEAIENLLGSDLALSQMEIAEEPEALQAALNPGELYQLSMSEEERFKSGAVYTPAPLAEFMLNRIIEQVGGLEALLSRSVIDPSIGGGIFTASLIRILKQRRVDRDTILSFAQHNMHGLDIDPYAVMTARCAMLLEILELKISCHQLLATSTALRENFQLGDALTTLKPAQYDVVVMNPPYGLSRGEKMLPAQVRELKARFAGVMTGKPNKYLAFMALGIETLKPNGVLCCVTPNSWLGINSGYGIRKTLLENCTIGSVDLFNRPLFAERGVEGVVTCVTKANSRPNHKIRLSHFNQPEDRQAHYSCDLPRSVPLGLPELVIPTKWSTICSTILSRIGQSYITLSDTRSPFTCGIALQAYALGKGDPPQTREAAQRKAFHRSETAPDTIPYLDPSKLNRYRYTQPNTNLRYGPWLAEHPPIERYTKPRVILREILAPPPYTILAAVCTETLTYNRSILHIHLKPSFQDVELLWGLCGILNSLLGTFVIRHFGKKSQRKLFPKIVIQDLKDFPLPIKLIGDRAKIQQIAEKTRAVASTNDSALPTPTQHEIDLLVCEVYQLDSLEILRALSCDQVHPLATAHNQ